MPAAAAFVLALALSPLIAHIMRRFGIVDMPRGERKIHDRKIPLGGGLAVFAAFFMIVFWNYSRGALDTDVSLAQLIAMFIGGAVIMVGGIVDDVFDLSPRYQIMLAVAAVLVVIFSPLRPDVITNPFGGAWSLRSISFPIDGLAQVVLLADVVTFLWLMGIMFTTKILDGLDGLAAGIAAIGALLLSILTLQQQWYQPGVARLALILMGSCLGFLVWNWHPARVFLGQGGSLFIGFMLAILALLAGGKIATAFLVLGVPILDIIRVATYRVWHGQSVFHADNEHLHYKLLRSGLSHRQAVLLLYTISFLFGMTTLFFQSRQLLVALSFLLALFLLLGIWLSRRPTSSKPQS